MATLTIRNIDTKIRDHLRVQAASHGRSMEAEVRHILECHTRRQQTNPGEIARRIQRRFSELDADKDLTFPHREPLPNPPSFDE